MHLSEDPRWVGWRWVERGGRRTKPPFQPSGEFAHNDRPETWSTVAAIVEAAPVHRFDGLGLELLGLTGFAALDLDKVRDPDTGVLLPWAEEAARSGSYAEVTPSGTGLRILGRVAPDESPCHRKFRHPGGGEVEFYVNTSTGRYITVTGDRLRDTPDALASVSSLVAKLWAEVALVAEPSGFTFDAAEPTLDTNRRSPTTAPDFAALPQRLRVTISHGRSGDRSADFQAAVNWLRTRVSFDTALRLFREHPGGPAGKYGDRLEAELRRSWSKAETSAISYAGHGSKAEMGDALERDGGDPGQQPGDDAANPAKAAPKITELTEDGVALAFTARFAGRLRFDHDTGQWFEWTGDRWKADGTGLAFSWCRQVARDLSRKAKESEKAVVGRRSFAAGVEAFARADRAHAVCQDVWDRDPFLLGVPGGVVDLRTGRLAPANPMQGLTKLAAVAPAERDDCPRWKTFMLQAAGGGHETVAFLRRWFGYCLTGDTREHALIFFWGSGGNGKSVLLNTVSRIMGDYATTAAMDTFTASRGDKHPTELALLRGARMVSASETEEGRSWAEARIKQMTGGDRITARFMRQDFFTYLPQFKLTIIGNHAPALANVDDAARRRFNVVPFIHQPAHRDGELETKLEAEWPAILRWMIDGTVGWLEKGLMQPASVRAATADYFSEQDMTRRWLEEACTLTPANPSHWETAAGLFKSWSDFAKANGEEPGSAKSMAARLRRHGLRDCFKWWNGRSVRAWEGVEILTQNREGAHG